MYRRNTNTRYNHHTSTRYDHDTSTRTLAQGTVTTTKGTLIAPAQATIVTPAHTMAVAAERQGRAMEGRQGTGRMGRRGHGSENQEPNMKNILHQSKIPKTTRITNTPKETQTRKPNNGNTKQHAKGQKAQQQHKHRNAKHARTITRPPTKTKTDVSQMTALVGTEDTALLVMDYTGNCAKHTRYTVFWRTPPNIRSRAPLRQACAPPSRQRCPRR